MVAPLVGSTQGLDTHNIAGNDFQFRLTEYGGGTSLRQHRHECAKVSTAVRGAYTETFGARRFECDSNTLLLKPPDISHADRYEGPVTVCLTVDIQAGALEMIRSLQPMFLDVERVRLRTPLLAKIVGELYAPDPFSPLALEGYALELITALARRVTPRGRQSAAFARACDFLDGHLSSSVRLSTIAAAAGVHPAHLSRLFRIHAGCSPGEWLRSRRLEEAKRRLRSDDTSLAVIALDLAFYDQSHFSNVFRRHVGMTPAEFRRVHAR